MATVKPIILYAGVKKEIQSGDVLYGLPSASDTVAGIAEAATIAETNTGTDTGRFVTPDGLAGSNFGKIEVEIYMADLAASVTVGDGKGWFVVTAKINGWNLVDAHAAVPGGNSTSGTPNYQLRRRRGGSDVDMLTTKITIDANEPTSYTAATAAVVNTSNDDLAAGDFIFIDKDVAGTGEKGDVVILVLQLP